MSNSFQSGHVLIMLSIKALWDEKFKSVAKRIERHRLAHLKKAERDEPKQVKKWQRHLAGKKNEHDQAKPFDEAAYIMDNDISWAWALQDEMPPPSAIVGRRDTASICVI